MTVEELGEYIKENWNNIREQIRRREYKPQPVRRVEIPNYNFKPYTGAINPENYLPIGASYAYTGIKTAYINEAGQLNLNFL